MRIWIQTIERWPSMILKEWSSSINERIENGRIQCILLCRCCSYYNEHQPFLFQSPSLFSLQNECWEMVNMYSETTFNVIFVALIFLYNRCRLCSVVRWLIFRFCTLQRHVWTNISFCYKQVKLLSRKPFLSNPKWGMRRIMRSDFHRKYPLPAEQKVSFSYIWYGWRLLWVRA